MRPLEPLTRRAGLWLAVILVATPCAWVLAGAPLPESATAAWEAGRFGRWLLVGLPLLFASFACGLAVTVGAGFSAERLIGTKLSDRNRFRVSLSVVCLVLLLFVLAFLELDRWLALALGRQ